ncbi:MAG: helix-turn-helix domain-containing protein [Myxococcales bacterium]|nr:helix-turn-helix domain-containing protein [Myxococcales bacterium]
MAITQYSASKTAGARTSASKSAGDRRARLLEGLGAAVRALRTERALTLRALAKVASVSERFLVQLEAGEGNISVARLEDVAEALGTTGAELLAQASRPHTKSSSSSRAVLALVGLRGAGKSSIGAAVARRLGLPFIELDEAIVREAQMTLPSIFEIHGEAYYRQMERDVLRRLLDSSKPAVLATGGSIVTDAETWGLLRSRARTVWLKATPREHWDRVVAQGDVRPMRGRPRAMNELRQLLTSRTPLYEQADVTVDTSGRTVTDVVERLASMMPA